MLDLSKYYLKDNKRVIVAVSGGPDSMALLDMLRNTLFEITVCHVNYHKRESSDRDEKIVADYCQKYNLNLFVHNAYGGEGNFQDWARRERYNFFKSIYEEVKAAYLFVAHQQDDLLETYLFKKQRHSVGNSLTIKESEEVFGMTLIRPLLDTSKDDLAQYCVSRGIEYGEDETNYSPIYTRNKIRLEIINKMSREEKDKLLLEIKEEEEKWQSKRLLAQKSIQEKEISLADFLKLEPDIKCLAIYELLISSLPSLYPNLSLKRLKEMVKEIESPKPNIHIHLKDDYVLFKAYDRIYIDQEKEGYSYQIDSLKELETPDFILSFKGPKKMDGIATIDSDFPLTIRTYQKDDFIVLKEGKKTVSRLFIDKKVPLGSRKRYPIVINNNGDVIFVPGLYRFYERKYWQNNLYVLKY